MNLVIGLAFDQPGWRMIFRQEGIPFKIVHLTQEVEPDQISVLVVNTGLDPLQKQQVQRYLNYGGAVITDAALARLLFNIEAKRSKIRYLIPNSESIFTDIALCNLDVVGTLPAAAQHLLTYRGHRAIQVQEFGDGCLLILPFDVNQLMFDKRVKRRNFYFQKSRLPSERVSRVSKGQVRKIVRRALEYLHHRRGLPFVSLWYFPDGKPTIFAFRVDTDFGSQEEVNALYQVCKDNEIGGCWYVETKSQSAWIHRYREMEGQEIGLHCYRHRTFRNYQKNMENIRRGKAILANAGIEAQGFVSPYGEWNVHLAQAIEDQGFKYSSEFALDYDNLPFFPYIGNRYSNVLQIPIHPVSFGGLRRAGFNDDEMFAYFRALITQKKNDNEATFLIHHPHHKRLDLIDRIFEFVKENKIFHMRLGDYASWWIQKLNVDLSLEFEGETIFLYYNNPMPSLWLRISHPQKGVVFCPLKSKIILGQLDWGAFSKYSESPKDVLRLRKFNWRMLIHDIEFLYGRYRR
ncbi:DUF2334 domain-containing protein [candidate division KSB1 bacterium]|nr:DUF2334 domain-containing protein [candidate division KSB1 bacterium]